MIRTILTEMKADIFPRKRECLLDVKKYNKEKTDLDPKSNFALLALWSTAWSQTTSNKDSLILHLYSLIGILYKNNHILIKLLLDFGSIML